MEVMWKRDAAYILSDLTRADLDTLRYEGKREGYYVLSDFFIYLWVLSLNLGQLLVTLNLAMCAQYCCKIIAMWAIYHTWNQFQCDLYSHIETEKVGQCYARVSSSQVVIVPQFSSFKKHGSLSYIAKYLWDLVITCKYMYIWTLELFKFNRFLGDHRTFIALFKILSH